MDRSHAVMLPAAILAAAIARRGDRIHPQAGTGAAPATAVLYGGSTTVTLMLVYFTALSA